MYIGTAVSDVLAVRLLFWPFETLKCLIGAACIHRIERSLIIDNFSVDEMCDVCILSYRL